MDPDRATLARCVGDVEAFARDHWGRAPLLRRGAGPFDDLLDVAAAEALLVQTARRPTFRLVRSGESLPVEDVTTTVRLGGRTVHDAADVARIGAGLASGATLVLQGLQRTWLPLARFCRSLERATSHPVQANAYLTPPGAAGLGRHADAHAVLVLQVEGTKQWTVDGLGGVVLAAGDVLYLPAGTAHQAAAQEATSLHLTIGLLADTYHRAIGRMLDDHGQELGLERPLPLGFARPEGAGELAAGLAEVAKRAAEHLGALDVDEWVTAEGRRARRRRVPLWTGHLRSVLASLDLDDRARVRVRADNPAQVLAEPDASGRVTLELVDRRLLLPPTVRPALETLLAVGELTVADLPGLGEEGRAVLVRRLVREGLLEIVTG